MRRIIIIGTISIVVALVAYFIWNYFVQNQKFQLTSSNPSNFSTKVSVESKISLHFNRDLTISEDTNNFEISPRVEGVKSIQNSTLIFSPENTLKPETTYTIQLKNVTSQQNETLPTISIVFTTNQDTSDRAQFIKTLPINTDTYSITYDEAINTFVVTINKNPYDSSKQAALDFLTSKGIQINLEKINFQELRFLRGSGAPPG